MPIPAPGSPAARPTRAHSLLALLARPLAGVALAAAMTLGGTALQTARADEFSDRANARFKEVQTDKRSDLVLLPLLIKLADPPQSVGTVQQAMLLPATSALFKDAAAWAQAEPQKAVLDVLTKISGESDWKKAYAFAQPYGITGIDPELIAAKAFTDLGDPPLLARAKHGYLPMLDKMNLLVHVEATRLQAEGKPLEALDVLWRWLHFSRSMCDRAFYVEVVWGLKTMSSTLERMRDVVYTDGRLDKPLLTPEQLRDTVEKRMGDRGGILNIDRMQFPSGNEVGCEQLINRVFKPRGAADISVFSPLLAEIAIRNRPLRLFSEAARWDSIAKLHGNQLETFEALRNAFGDWRTRWELPPFDPALKLRQDYRRLDAVKFAAVIVNVGDLSPIFDMRKRVRVELGGTRVSMGVQGYVLGQKSNPPALTSIRPAYTKVIDIDPLDQTTNPFRYYVPVRDGIKDAVNPATFYEITVFPGDNLPAFKRKLDQSYFMLFSVGPDGDADGCMRATQTVEDDKGDYLVWPPVLSLLREQLTASGALK